MKRSLRPVSSWRDGKSVLERLTYMFETRLATDVIFYVGGEKDATADLAAHKVILIAKSSVFETMFCGDLNDNIGDINGIRIRIHDVDAGSFREMLRYRIINNPL